MLTHCMAGSALLICLIYFLTGFSKNIAIIIGVVLLLLAAAYPVNLISETHLLHWANLLSLLGYKFEDDKYRTLCILNRAVPVPSFQLILLLIIIFSLLMIGHITREKIMPFGSNSHKRIRIKALQTNKLSKSHSLLFYEFRKYYITQRGVLLLIAFLFINSFSINLILSQSNLEHYFYSYYSQKYSGELSSEKYIQLKEELSLLASEVHADNQSDSIRIIRESQLQIVAAEYKELLERKVADQRISFYINQNGWKYLFLQSNPTYGIFLLIETLLVVIIPMLGIMRNERFYSPCMLPCFKVKKNVLTRSTRQTGLTISAITLCSLVLSIFLPIIITNGLSEWGMDIRCLVFIPMQIGPLSIGVTCLVILFIFFLLLKVTIKILYKLIYRD